MILRITSGTYVRVVLFYFVFFVIVQLSFVFFVGFFIFYMEIYAVPPRGPFPLPRKQLLQVPLRPHATRTFAIFRADTIQY